MSCDLLIDELAALKINDDEFIIFSPYNKLFVKFPVGLVEDLNFVEQLRQKGILGLPTATREDHSSTNIVLNVTRKCNLYCKYCWSKSGPDLNEQMTPDAAISIVADLMASREIEKVHFIGGEPTLNFEAISAVVEYLNDSCSESLPVFYITTNGIIPEATLDWLIVNNFAFTISWDGLHEAHNCQRSFIDGKQSEEIVRASILKVANSGLPLRVRMTASKLNLSHLHQSVSWLADNGVKFVHIESVSPDGRDSVFADEHSPTPNEFVDEFFRIVELAEEKGIWLMNSHLGNLYSPKNYYCSSLKGRIFNFNPDSSISNCYKIQNSNDPYSDQFTIGQYGKGLEFVEIDKRKFKATSAIDVTNYSKCDNYAFKNYYSGGCPYRNLVVTGTQNEVDPNMYQMNQLLVKKAILHIYEQSLKGKPSALEGYVKFYEELTKISSNESVNAFRKQVDLGEQEELFKGLDSIKFIPVPMSSRYQLTETYACDICI